MVITRRNAPVTWQVSVNPLAGNGITGRGRDSMFEAGEVKRVEVRNHGSAERENDKRDRRGRGGG